jgi:hypothetical protein
LLFSQVHLLSGVKWRTNSGARHSFIPHFNLNSKFVDGIYPFELKLRDTLPETRVQWGKIHTPKLNEK